MKTVLNVSLLVVLFCACNNSTTGTSINKTEMENGIATSTFKVWGNCGMCKNTIEGSLKTEGIKSADWNVESKIITVEYDTSKITLDQIQRNIAGVGYDNDVYTGGENAYNNLHECCKYDRK